MKPNFYDKFPHHYHDPNSTKWEHTFRNWFGDHRHFRPWYDSDADYNTNAKSYYDYLGYRIRLFDVVVSKVNELLDRDIEVIDTPSIDLTKENDWSTGDTLLKLYADVKRSTQELNALKENEDGLYVEDLQPKIDALQAQIDELRKRIEALEAVVYNKAQYISIPDENIQITYFNGNENSPDPSLGTTYAKYAIVNKNVMLFIHYNWYNSDLSRLRLSGQVTKPFEQRPESVMLGVSFTGEYSWLNNLKTKLSDSLVYGAIIVSPTQARASWKPDYSINLQDTATGRPHYNLVLDTYGDGYNTQWTFRDNYQGQHLSTSYGSNISYYATYQMED